MLQTPTRTAHPLAKLLVLILTFAATRITLAADPFPGGSGIPLHGALPPGYEFSDAVWNPLTEQLFVVSDAGSLARMNREGGNVQTWYVGGYDLEGVCFADHASDRIYLGVENPDAIIEFDLTTGAPRRAFNLTPWLTGPENQGLEALTFVPDENHPEGGRFYAGLQYTGVVFAFTLPIVSSQTSTAVTLDFTFSPAPGRGDLSGLDYHRPTGVLYAIWDAANRLRATTAVGLFLAEWVLPGADQEGVAAGACELFIAEDCGHLFRYSFPVDSGDDDGDGVPNCADACPDTPAGAPVDAFGCSGGDVLLGDLDCDGGVTFADINPFVLALCNLGQYQLEYPGCNRLAADCNLDGSVDLTDVNAFVPLLGERASEAAQLLNLFMRN